MSAQTVKIVLCVLIEIALYAALYLWAASLGELALSVVFAVVMTSIFLHAWRAFRRDIAECRSHDGRADQ